MSISQPFKELQGWNLEFKLITPKSITGTYSDTKLSRFGLASLPMVVILDFQMSISQLFEKLQSWNLELKLITPISVSCSHRPVPKQSKMATIVQKWEPVIDIGVISFNSKFQLCSSSNSWDMHIWISKMAAIGKPAKPNLLSLVSK